MDKPVIIFLRNLLIFSFILGTISYGIAFVTPDYYITPALPFLFVFFISVTLLGYYLLIKNSGQKFTKFVNSYLLITTVKLLLFIAIIFLYLFLNRNDAAPFGVSFFILYVVYSVFEVVSLLSYTKGKLKQ